MKWLYSAVPLLVTATALAVWWLIAPDLKWWQAILMYVTASVAVTIRNEVIDGGREAKARERVGRRP